MKYAVLIGVAPIVLEFLAGFFGLAVPSLSWAVLIAWLALSIAIGAAVTARKG